MISYQTNTQKHTSFKNKKTEWAQSTHPCFVSLKHPVEKQHQNLNKMNVARQDFLFVGGMHGIHISLPPSTPLQASSQ